MRNSVADDAPNRAALQIELARAFSDTTAVLSAAATVVGLELGLFDLLASGGADAASLAGRSGLDARFIHAWLESQLEAGVLQRDEGGYRLDPEHRAMFRREGGPYDVIGLYRTAVGLCGDLPRIVESVRTGRAIGDAELSEGTRSGFSRLAEARAERWLDEWVGLVPDLERALVVGIAVGDLGGGTGALARQVAERYPRCRVTLIDPLAPDRLSDRFRVERVTIDRIDDRFDLVLSIEAFHHLAEPAQVARAVRDRLQKPGGRWLVVEPLAPEPGLLRRHLAAMSALYCVPTVLGTSSSGEGSLILAETVIGVLTGAGFSEVEIAGRTSQHCVIEGRV